MPTITDPQTTQAFRWEMLSKGCNFFTMIDILRHMEKYPCMSNEKRSHYFPYDKSSVTRYIKATHFLGLSERLEGRPYTCRITDKGKIFLGVFRDLNTNLRKPLNSLTP